MRTTAAFILFGCLAGCSVIFDMGDYDGRATSSGGPSSSSSGSSGRLPDGAVIDDDGSGGARDASIGPDATDDRASFDCTAVDTEPNDSPPLADAFEPGELCGVLDDETDVDFFAFSTGSSVTMTITIPNDVKLEVFRNGSLSPMQSYTGGGGTVTSPAGDYLIRVTHIGAPGTLSAYKLAR